MPRSAAELNAELDRLKDEAEKLDDDAHTRLTNAGQTIDTARAKTLEVQTSLSSALAEIAVNNIREAEKHCAQARYRLAVARANVAEAFAGVAGADPKDEWKECRASIDRFDKLLVDLRKTGFGFITTLVGAAALLLGTSGVTAKPEFKFAAFSVIVILIITLFGVDRSHQIWLNAAVARAIELEKGLKYQITQGIGKKFRGWDGFVLGVCLYLVLIAATAAIFWFDLEGSPDWQKWTLYGGIAGAGVTILVAIISNRR